MDLVSLTYKYKAQPNADWSKFTALQHELIGWLESDD